MEKPRFVRIRGRIVPIGAKKGQFGNKERAKAGAAAGTALGMTAGVYHTMFKDLVHRKPPASMSAFGRKIGKWGLIGGALGAAAILSKKNFRPQNKRHEDNVKGYMPYLAPAIAAGLYIKTGGKFGIPKAVKAINKYKINRKIISRGGNVIKVNFKKRF